MYLSNYQVQTLIERLTKLLGYPPKEALVINLAFEIEVSLKPFFSDVELLQHYRAIEKLHS
jgi:hypothetical protein